MIAIDGYSEIERIGQGGLGDVYRAQRDSTGATVAIKVLRDVSDESLAWHRTRRELTALVSLAGHANVVQLLEVLDLPDGPALVVEYAPGGSIADLMLRRDEPLTVGETVLVGRQTATALTAAHERGIVHRDVKPQNLLIDAYGQVKLCDFGIAAMARSDEFQTRTSAISMRYASPEDLDDDVDVGPASDVYSLGATMLHMARGAPPTLKERLAPWLPPTTADPQLAELDRVVAACLHPSPSRRPSASQVADDLERLGWSIDERNRQVDGAPSGAPPDGRVAARPNNDPSPLDALDDLDLPTTFREVVPDHVDDTVSRPPPPEPTPPPARRRRWPWVAVAMVLVAVGAVVALTRGAPAYEVVDRPADLPSLQGLTWPDGPLGECLVQVADRVDPTPCGEPHDLERIGAGPLDDVATDSDEGAVRDAVRARCDAAFVAYVGAPVDDVDLDAPFTAPSAATWANGDRGYQCFVGVADRRLVGSVVDSG